VREPHAGGPVGPVVAVTNLSRSFGPRKALNDVTLAVSRGCVFGLVGEHGAGTSTLIKHLLGLLRAETGGVAVFGPDLVSEPTAVLGRIGCLSEQPDLPGWMHVAELLRYTQALSAVGRDVRGAPAGAVRHGSEPPRVRLCPACLHTSSACRPNRIDRVDPAC
jgi:ABC-type transport system involved in cytochrome c biogenesis ATPase subunit